MNKSKCTHSLADLELESKRFMAKKDIKPWLASKLLNHRGIRIAIERSDSNKIIFKCKQRNGASPCSFRIRANFLIKLSTWSLVVINDTHNHDMLLSRNNRPAKRDRSKSRLIESISKQIGLVIDTKIAKNDGLSESDKISIMESLTLKYISNNSKYLSDTFLQQLSNKSDKVINWSLIPLSPLLNDDTNHDTSSNSIENLIHLPGLNLGQNMMLQNPSHNIPINNYSMAVNAIQNQNNQLPSFNSIQNKLPLSPTNLPTINSSTTTLNPSHLLKSSKSYGSSAYLNDFKSYTLPLNNLKIGPIKDIAKNNANVDNLW